MESDEEKRQNYDFDTEIFYATPIPKNPISPLGGSAYKVEITGRRENNGFSLKQSNT